MKDQSLKELEKNNELINEYKGENTSEKFSKYLLMKNLILLLHINRFLSTCDELKNSITFRKRNVFQKKLNYQDL